MKTKQIKDAIRNKFAWPGGYEIFAITSDGAILCTDCMKDNLRIVLDSTKKQSRDGWQITGIDCAQSLECREYVEENTDQYCLDHCDHCNKVLNP